MGDITIGGHEPFTPSIPDTFDSDLLLAATLPPASLLVLIATLTILIIAICLYQRRKLADERNNLNLAETAYYSVVGPPPLPARTLNREHKGPENVEPIYWTIADENEATENEPEPTGIDTVHSDHDQHTQILEGSVNGHHILNTQSSANPLTESCLPHESDSDCTSHGTSVSNGDVNVEGGDSIDHQLVMECGSPGPSEVDFGAEAERQIPQRNVIGNVSQVVAAKNPTFGTNDATVPEIGMESDSHSRSADSEVNPSQSPDPDCLNNGNEFGDTIIQDVVPNASNSQPSEHTNGTGHSQQLNFEGEMVQEIVHTTPDFTNIVAARNPAYGTNIAIAPEIGTEVNVAYGFSCGSEETPGQEPHRLSSCQGAVDASILMESNPSYGTNVSTAPEIATHRNPAYDDIDQVS